MYIPTHIAINCGFQFPVQYPVIVVYGLSVFHRRLLVTLQNLFLVTCTTIEALLRDSKDGKHVMLILALCEI